MTGLAEVAPVAPAFSAGAIALGALVSFVVLWGLDKFWRATLGPLFVRIGNVGFGGFRGHGAVHPLHFLVSASNAVEGWIKQGMAATERAMVNAFGTFLWTFYDLAFTLLKLGYDLNTAIDNVWHEATTGTTKVIRQTVVRPVQKAATYSDAKLRAQVHSLTVRVDHLAARVADTATATAGAIAAPFPRIGKLEREVHDATKWLRKHRYLAAYTSLAALGLAMLKRLGLGWLRCGNVNKAGKAVCGMNPGLLEALLFDAAALAVAFNLEEFAEEMQTVTEEAASLIHTWAA